MPSRSRRTIVYNLSGASASAREAFEHGLDLHSDEEDHPNRMGSSPPGSSGRARYRQQESAFVDAHRYPGQEHQPRGAGDLLAGRGGERETVELLSLVELFPHADRTLIEEVYCGCGNSFDAALDTLSELLGAASEPQPPAAAAHPGGSSDAGYPALPSSQHPSFDPSLASASSTSATTHGPGSAAALQPTTSWGDLPEEVKELVLGMLPIIDVARAAATCREFARRVKLGAVNAKVLTIPTGLSLSGIIGMVAGHPNAHTVNLVRWGRKGLQDRDFAALLTAISNGSRSSRRNTPVESLSLRGWSGLKDGHIMTVCSTLQHLKELDLTDCSGLTDAALLVLSKYQRAPPPSPPDAPSSPVHGARLGPESDSDDEADGGAAGQGTFRGASPSASSTPAGRGMGGARAATGAQGEEAGGGEDDMLFEMDATGGEAASAAATPTLTPGPSSLPPRPHRRGSGPGFGGEEEAGGDGSGLRAMVRGMLRDAGEGEEEDEGEEEEEEEEEGDGEQRERRLAALAALAASPPVSSGVWGRYGSSPGAAGAASLGASPPSSSMTPDTALGAQIARLGLRGSTTGGGTGAAWGAGATPGGNRGSSGGGGGRTPQSGGSAARAVPGAGAAKPGAGAGAGVGAQSGWVGSWERRGLTLPPWQQGRAQQAQHLQHPPSASSSPAAAPSPAGTSPPGGSSGMTPWRAPPRLTFAAGPGLRSLILAGCAQISADGVRALLAAPGPKGSLEALDVSRCQRMTRQALHVPPQSCLRVLKCSGCNNLHEVIIQLPPTCPLTELHLNNCKQLTRVLIVAPNLRLLHIGGCKNMVNVSLRCAHLTQLLANLCFSWAQVTPEQWLVPRLQHLNLFGARHLDSASVQVMLSSCPGLKHLNLNGCNTVTEVDIPEELASLTTLDISGCKGLVRLRATGQGLREVVAKACPRLQEVWVESTQLRRLDVSHCSALQSLVLQALQQHRALLLPAAPPPPLPPLPPGAQAGIWGPAAAAPLWPGVGPGNGASAALAAVAAASALSAVAPELPQLCTLYAERGLPMETVALIRAAKAARRAAAAEARLGSDQPAGSGA